jgi:hypothetical protein
VIVNYSSQKGFFISGSATPRINTIQLPAKQKMEMSTPIESSFVRHHIQKFDYPSSSDQKDQEAQPASEIPSGLFKIADPLPLGLDRST